MIQRLLRVAFGILWLWSLTVRADLVKNLEELDRPSVSHQPAAASPLPRMESPLPLAPPRSPSPPPGLSSKKGRRAKADTPQPAAKVGLHQERKLTFSSDLLVGSRKQGMAELQGNVKIHHGELYLQAKKAQIFFDATSKELSRVVASGEVVLEKKALEGGAAEAVYASGGKVEYDRGKNVIFLSQNAMLRQGADVVRGDMIKYQVDTGIVQAQQVQGNLNPEAGEKSLEDKKPLPKKTEETVPAKLIQDDRRDK